MPPPGQFLAGHLSAALYFTPALISSTRRATSTSTSTSIKKKSSAANGVDDLLLRCLLASRDNDMNQVHFANASARRRNAMILEGANMKDDEDEDAPKGLIANLRLALPHIALITATLFYIFLGALIFAYIEIPYEKQTYKKHHLQYHQFIDTLFQSPNLTEIEIERMIDDYTTINFQAFEAGLRPIDLVTEKNTTKWTLISSIFFTTTVLTSIGYGNLIPISTHGQIFCMCYAIFGIPLTLITIADVAKFVADILIMDPTEDIKTGRQFLVLILLLGYMTISAVVYWILEPTWSFIDSFYFCLVSLMTVGFGDLYPTGTVQYMSVSIVFIFIGLVLTTLAVDVSGSVCIDKIHSLGRGFDAMKVLNALKENVRQKSEEAARKGAELRQLRKKGDDERQRRRQQQVVDIPRWFAYVPKDALTIPYIDESARTDPQEQRLLVQVCEKQNELQICSTSSASDGDANNNATSSSSPRGRVETCVNMSSIDEVCQIFEALHPNTMVFTKGPLTVRHFLIPLYVQNGRCVPLNLLSYYDIDVLLREIGEDQEVDVVKMVTSLENEQLARIHQTIELDYKSAAVLENISENRQVRARGLPWQASDQHVAQFFAGLDITPGGIALCLSSEGRRNGEVLVHFENEMSRDLALRRHRNFLLSRYIEVYKATLEEFMQVASGSSTEAMEFVSTNAINVRMRGLPYDCTEQQIKSFFEPLKVLDKILFITRSDGRPTGDAFVQFAIEEEAQQALLKHRQTIGQRYIELFKSTAAEVQQVVKRCNQINTTTNAAQLSPNEQQSQQQQLQQQQQQQQQMPQLAAAQQPEEKRKDCIRLRGLPYEAQVQHIVTFLGDYAKMVKFQGVHMIFNNQGHPSGEAFIQMHNEQAASATSLAVHNKYMVIGKKQRYIEVFQCSAEDLNLQHLVKPQPVQTALSFAPQQIPPSTQQYWTGYPSPPISPIIPGQLTQLVVYGITMNVGIPELVAQFSSPEIHVENVIFTRWPTPVCPGEAVITIRSRQPAHLPHLYQPTAPATFPHQQQFLQAPIILEQ